MKISKVRTYLYRGSNYWLTYESTYRKGSWNNYADLDIQQHRLYGKYTTINSYEDYKKQLNRIVFYK